MTDYEVMLIFDPALDDEVRVQTLETIRSIIAAQGEPGDVDDWGVRKLAYPINKKAEGYYAVMQFRAEPELPKELDRRLRISDNVMRHLIVRKDGK